MLVGVLVCVAVLVGVSVGVSFGVAVLVGVFDATIEKVGAFAPLATKTTVPLSTSAKVKLVMAVPAEAVFSNCPPVIFDSSILISAFDESASVILPKCAKVIVVGAS